MLWSGYFSNFKYWLLVTVATSFLTVALLWLYIVIGNTALKKTNTEVLGKTDTILTPSKKVASTFDTLSLPRFFAPKALTIESLEIKRAQIVPVSVEEDGAMETPRNAYDIGWYKNGPGVGESGNIVLAGHYDWLNAQKGVFFTLSNITKGDKVLLFDSAGKAKEYVVYDVLYVDNDDISAVNEVFRDTDYPELTLITCGGVWNYLDQTYDKRLLVKARLVSSTQ